jgi:hypothetical protein
VREEEGGHGRPPPPVHLASLLAGFPSVKNLSADMIIWGAEGGRIESRRSLRQNSARPAPSVAMHGNVAGLRPAGR